MAIFKEKDDFLCFQAATERRDDKIVNTGGRTLTLVGLGNNVESARAKIYKEMEPVDLSGYIFRKDIAKLFVDNKEIMMAGV